MKIFISGGCKNGKSSYAEKLTKAMESEEGLYYVATMIPSDEEDVLRIENHRESRSSLGFETLEISENIFKNMKNYSFKGAYIVDSTTALLTNQMFKGKKFFLESYKEVACDFEKILDVFQNIVIVSDYIYSDAILYDETTIAYQKGLAFVDRVIAKQCDVVIEVLYGNIIIHKGKEILEELCYEFY